MERIYLLLGTNLGEKKQNLQRAFSMLEAEIAPVLAISGIYETAAWGNTAQPSFLNQALALESAMTAPEVLRLIKGIEQKAGRITAEKWGPRILDIDMLFFGEEIINLPELQVPHPFLQIRRFALKPLCEIAPEMVHPVLAKTVRQLLTECPDQAKVSHCED